MIASQVLYHLSYAPSSSNVFKVNICCLVLSILVMSSVPSPEHRLWAVSPRTQSCLD
jgi:hypothetical protein